MVVGREALFSVPAPALLVGRLLGATAVFSVLARREGTRKIAREDRGALLLCALSGAALNQVFFIYGLERTTATHASALSACIPVLTLILAASLGREKLDLRKTGGILLGLGGALGLVMPREGGQPGATLLGDVESTTAECLVHVHCG